MTQEIVTALFYLLKWGSKMSSYLQLIANYKRNEMRKGVVPTKIYLSIEQVAELYIEAFSLCANPIGGPYAIDKPTVLGLEIVEVDFL